MVVFKDKITEGNYITYKTAAGTGSGRVMSILYTEQNKRKLVVEVLDNEKRTYSGHIDVIDYADAKQIIDKSLINEMRKRIEVR